MDGYNFGAKIMFSGIKSDFLQISVDSQGLVWNGKDLHPSGEGSFMTSYL